MRVAGRSQLYSTCAVGVALAMLAGWVSAGDDPAGIRIQYSASGAIVAIERTTSLRSVLVELCQVARAHCEGLELLEDGEIPPQTLAGSWSEVVSKLLEGARVNYLALGPSSNEAPRMLVLSRSSAADTPGEKGQQRGQGEVAGNPRHPVADSQEGAIADQSLSSDQGSADDSRPAGRPSHSSAENKDHGVLGVGGSSGYTGTGTSGSAVSTSPTGSLPPFMGGPALPTSPTAGAFLPFPDSQGNPIPVTPHQGPPMLPFPDSQGRPIPVLPAPPGPNVMWPFPPNPMTAPR